MANHRTVQIGGLGEDAAHNFILTVYRSPKAKTGFAPSHIFSAERNAYIPIHGASDGATGSFKVTVPWGQNWAGVPVHGATTPAQTAAIADQSGTNAMATVGENGVPVHSAPSSSGGFFDNVVTQVKKNRAIAVGAGVVGALGLFAFLRRKK